MHYAQQVVTFFSKPSSSDSDELKEPPIVADDYPLEDDGYPNVDIEPDYSPNIPNGESDIAFKREKGEAILMGDTIATYDKKGKFLVSHGSGSEICYNQGNFGANV